MNNNDKDIIINNRGQKQTLYHFTGRLEFPKDKYAFINAVGLGGYRPEGAGFGITDFHINMKEYIKNGWINSVEIDFTVLEFDDHEDSEAALHAWMTGFLSFMYFEGMKLKWPSGDDAGIEPHVFIQSVKRRSLYDGDRNGPWSGDEASDV